MPLPGSWGEVYGRLSEILCVDDSEVETWLREALRAAYGVESLRDLDRRTRAVVFQKTCGVLYSLQDEPGDLAFDPRVRSIVATAFARYFGGVAPEGPPWRISPYEDLPTRSEYIATDVFD